MSQINQTDNSLLTNFDYVYLAIESMDDEELNQLVEAIDEQRLINQIKETKRVKLQQYLKNERIKMRQSLMRTSKDEFDSDIDEETEVRPKKVIKKKSK
jgi:uncharacterized protein YaaW (UPF0174 family)